MKAGMSKFRKDIGKQSHFDPMLWFWIHIVHFFAG